MADTMSGKSYYQHAWNLQPRIDIDSGQRQTRIDIDARQPYLGKNQESTSMPGSLT